MRRLAAPSAILAAALLLVWPAFLNRYPILFSDTGAFLAQTIEPLMIWDKPWVYGPLLHLFHGRQTLWAPLLAQGLMVSHLLWLVQRVLRGGATPAAHLLLCAALAALTALPWVTALLMPDIFAPVVVLALFLLGFAPQGALSRGETAYLLALAALGIAAHLSHIPLALALLVLTLLVARALKPLLRVAAPLAMAVLILLATNAVGHGKASLSPYGATFLLARLIADGPAARTIATECPQRGWYLCAWAGRLPEDSDVFLWEPESPVNQDAQGNPRFLGGVLLAPEAEVIIAETLRREPFGVATAALRNAAVQLFKAGLGDTLSRQALGDSVRPRLVQGFGAAEVAAHDGSAQFHDRLPALAAPVLWPQGPVLVLGAAALLFAWRALTRRGNPLPEAEHRLRLGFVLILLVGVTANALATGALSKPHHRYQARIAWLMPFGAAALLLPRRDSPATLQD
ncbi:hypothetical protein QMO56_09040 [Roseomonas sp. E05]|uniref:hypothetical protein n=1 Tax=Roseomonas sp. E05 TaxID=3046310 RepID=UPI0024B89A2A|nr:hypothetical protein [Roseomonas sp. E05]MDJ0388257.1 hypothetical protein [Roseomonas sp. E05]